MAKAGEKIYNPIQDDWIEFRETAYDTGGELMRGELVASRGGGNPLRDRTASPCAVFGSRETWPRNSPTIVSINAGHA